MSRYIDANHLRRWMLARWEESDPYTDRPFRADEILNQIDRELSVDIVRCQECKWRKADNSCDLNCRIEDLDGTETDMWFYVKPDDFCSYGERDSEKPNNSKD